jgi:hypothetical protein
MKHLLPLLILPTALIAQDYPLRDTDQRLSPTELTERLSGRDLVYFDNGRSRYYAEGRYSYTFDGDIRESNGGYWQVTQDGQVCAQFITGHSRCDLFVENAGRLVLIDSKGGRYPVKSIE